MTTKIEWTEGNSRRYEHGFLKLIVVWRDGVHVELGLEDTPPEATLTYITEVAEECRRMLRGGASGPCGSTKAAGSG